MSAVDDGGPAFPRTWSKNPSGGQAYLQDSCAVIDTTGGMSLRDWFAGQALANLAMMTYHMRPYAADASARTAYEYADAMIAARQSKTP